MNNCSPFAAIARALLSFCDFHHCRWLRIIVVAVVRRAGAASKGTKVVPLFRLGVFGVANTRVLVCTRVYDVRHYPHAMQRAVHCCSKQQQKGPITQDSRRPNTKRRMQEQDGTASQNATFSQQLGAGTHNKHQQNESSHHKEATNS